MGRGSHLTKVGSEEWEEDLHRGRETKAQSPRVNRMQVRREGVEQPSWQREKYRREPRCQRGRSVQVLEGSWGWARNNQGSIKAGRASHEEKARAVWKVDRCLECRVQL